MTIQIKATEHSFHLVLFIVLYKVVLIFKSVNETLVCDHSYENYRAELSCGNVYTAYLLTLYKIVLTFKRLKVFDLSKENFSRVP